MWGNELQHSLDSIRLTPPERFAAGADCKGEQGDEEIGSRHGRRWFGFIVSAFARPFAEIGYRHEPEDRVRPRLGTTVARYNDQWSDMVAQASWGRKSRGVTSEI